MDWDFAIERNREALKRVLLALVAMAGLAGGELPFSPPAGLRGRFAPQAQSCRAGGTTAGREGRDAAGGSGDPAGRWPEGPDEGCGGGPTLPRHLHRAVLRLLRPAESAARRLVIMAARGLVVALPPPRPRKPKPPAVRPGAVTGIWMPPHLRTTADRVLSVGRRAAAPRGLRLPLFDPLPRMPGAGRRPARGSPRLCVPGVSAPFPALPKRRPKGLGAHGPDDAIDAARLALRLGALAAALDDLPREARRFARWQARGAAGAGARNENRDAAGAQNENRGAAGAREGQAPARARRVWPLKPGRPPGLGRRAGAARDLSGSRRAVHPVHEILRDTHALALQALERPDTS